MKINYILVPFLGILVAVIGGTITDAGMDWYRQLALPAWTPSGAIIGFVWTAIYTLSIITVLIIWNDPLYRKDRTKISLLFAVNALLNVGWSYIFFGLHAIFGAFIEMFFLEATVIALILCIRRISVPIALLLYPYVLWVGFATFLTYTVLTLNT